MQEKDNHIQYKILQNAEMYTTNIDKCVLVKSNWCCTHYIVEHSCKEWWGVIVLLKDVETGVQCICSPRDICIESDTGVERLGYNSNKMKMKKKMKFEKQDENNDYGE